MMLIRLSFVAVLSLSLAGAASGQGLSRSGGPAELPPASFTGGQYVDSKGCAYIRAGSGNRATWVPRVNRKRQLQCGYQPTFARTAREPVATPAPVSRAARPVQSAPAPVAAAKAPPVAQPLRGMRAETVRPSATGAVPPRVHKCNVSGNCGRLIGPSGINERVSDAQKQSVPRGYRPAFDDGRFNPYRGAGTESGKAAMSLVWSNTVPRYLIDPATGKRVR